MADESTKTPVPGTVPAAPPVPASGRGPYLLAGALALLLVGAVIWKYSAVRHVEERAAAEKTQIVERTRKVIEDQTGYFLRLTMKPFVWAIRKEMLRENYEQVNEYLVQFVKEPRVRLVLVIDAGGKVVAATDKKLEGLPIAETRPGILLDGEDTTITKEPGGDLLVLTPVMGLSSRLGSLLLIYAPETVDFTGPQGAPKAP